MNVAKVRALLELNEGRRNRMYRDTKGIETIGIGHNLRDRAISNRAIDVIFEDDLADHTAELFAVLPWAKDQDEVRQAALIDLAFNLGLPKLLLFKNTLAAWRIGAYENAALGLRHSEWFLQVGRRATRIVKMVETGRWWDA